MSPHAIHLRSDSPALLVEFNLPPGTHARIGVSPTAEISLPLAGLADFAGVIGRTPEGRIYHADPNGENVRHIQLPAALSLPPYQFVVFHPAPQAETPPAKTALLQPPKKKLPRQTVFALAAVALAVATTAALIATNQDTKPPTAPGAISAAASSPAQPPPTKASDPTPSAQKAEAIPMLAKTAPEPAPPPVATQAVAPTKEALAPPAKLDLEALAKRVAPAVFRLEVKDQAGNITGTGTAFAISADGLAVTNFHVVDGGKSFTARTTQGAEFAVSGVIATDSTADLALIRLSARNLPFLELGESDSLNIGAPVAVFGAPRGLSGTLSNGILSAKRTGEDPTEKDPTNGGNLLQITDPISSGSSGSPVLDSAGKVVGVAVSGIVGPTSQNLNFAIPVEAVKILRRNASAGLADTLRKLFPGKPARITPASPPVAADPDSSFLDDPEYLNLKGFMDGRDWIRMHKSARLLIDRYPKSALAHAHLGYALNGLGLFAQSAAEFQSALSISPENALYWAILGDLQNGQEKHMEARESWKRSAGIDATNAGVWQRLASSYLLADDYAEAVAPLENLRRLDREKFDSLIGDLETVKISNLGLNALLAHLENLDEREITPAAPTKPEELAASLVAAFLDHGEGPDIQTELADYAATVNPYFDQGQQTREGIAKDITTYRAQWPRRSLRLVEIETARQDDINTLEATYRLRYFASNGKTTRSGTLRQGIRYTLTGGRWLVSGIQTIERIPESRVPTKER